MNYEDLKKRIKILKNIEPTEHDIQEVCIRYLKKNGWYVQRLDITNTKYRKGVADGTPDFMAFKKINYPNSYDLDNVSVIIPSLLFIEMKKPKHKPTPIQKKKMKELSRYGARCLTIHSLEELIEQL